MTTLIARRLGQPFVGDNPCMFHADHFDDGQHRLLIQVQNDHRELYKTADFVTWTTIDLDWMPDQEVQLGARTFQDSVVLPDNTILLYQNDNTEGRTAVWTGTPADLDAGTMTKVGRIVMTGGDAGAFHDPVTDLIHIYVEDQDSPFGSASSSKIRHWTTPVDDLLNATNEGIAADTGGSWGTGDPDIVKIGDTYYMFSDYTVSHPTYWVALWSSKDLYNWRLETPTLTQPAGFRGADFDAIDVGGRLIATSEYDNDENNRLGLWEILIRNDTVVDVGGTTPNVTVNGSSYRMRTAS